MTAPAHRCHARRCEAPIPPRMFMCGRHWRMVPGHMRTRIWATYRRGQEVRKDPSPEYLSAAKDAIDAVAELEATR